jgi:hypothetical protein
MTAFIPLTDASAQVLVKNLKSKIIAYGPTINSSQIETILEQWTQASAEASKAAAFIEIARQKTQETLIRIAADKLSPSEERLAQFLRRAVTVKMLRKAHLEIAQTELRAEISCEEETIKEYNRLSEKYDIASEHYDRIQDIYNRFYDIEYMCKEIKEMTTIEGYNSFKQDIVMVVRKVKKESRAINSAYLEAETNSLLASSKTNIFVKENISYLSLLNDLGRYYIPQKRILENYENAIIYINAMIVKGKRKISYRILENTNSDTLSQKRAIKKADRRQKRREEKEKEVNAYWDLEHYWSSRTAIEI